MFSLFLTNKKDAASAYATTRDASFVNFVVFRMLLLLRSLDFQSSLLSLGKLKASFRMLLLLRSLTVAAHELINTTCGVNELALTSVERVRGA